MPDRIHVLIAVTEPSLQEQLCQQLLSDWTIPWMPLTTETFRALPEMPEIAVLDKDSPTLELGGEVLLIFAGTPDLDSKYFAVQEDKDPEGLLRAIKRAYSYQEITRQNREALYPQHSSQDALESIAQTLSAKVHQLLRQSEMRIALVDQMPVGVLGIDDENMVVLANTKAIELLSVEDLPVWGLPVNSLLSSEVESFLRGPKERILISRCERQLELRKSPFLLDNAPVGTILVLWECPKDKND